MNAVPSKQTINYFMFLSTELKENGVDNVPSTLPTPVQKTERSNRKISVEMSELTLYCRATMFNRKIIEANGFNPREICSFSEQKAEREIFSQHEFFNLYHKVWAFLRLNT